MHRQDLLVTVKHLIVVIDDYISLGGDVGVIELLRSIRSTLTKVSDDMEVDLEPP